MKTQKVRQFSFVIPTFALLMLSTFSLSAKGLPSKVTMSTEQLKDKIAGGWAGQTIGCTYGGPTEFKYHEIIGDDVKIPWDNDRVKWYFDNVPGLYDDVYMDLTFVEVFQKEGLDAPIESFANAFANAPYPLWHANKQARYNILSGVKASEAGHWLNNPHADDIDFQIEADYAGLMAPGMAKAATYYTDAIGHLMNYGDGWYGGVYVANMYALAFVCDDVNYVVTKALESIPKKSKYYKAMADVISWHTQYPTDWKKTWQLLNDEYGTDIGCPDGVDRPFNIDAVLNSGYILIGLLYGEGDFGKTLDISTRCGQDSDCNPASAGGILGTMMGLKNIPDYWKKPLDAVEGRPFSFTDISLETATEYSLEQAKKVIAKNGGKVGDDQVTIKVTAPKTVRFEQSFPGMYPVSNLPIKKSITSIDKLEFEGNGVVVRCHNYVNKQYKQHGQVAEVEVYLDGKFQRVTRSPLSNFGDPAEIFYAYNLPEGKHTLTFKFLNKEDNMNIVLDNYVVYTGKK